MDSAEPRASASGYQRTSHFSHAQLARRNQVDRLQTDSAEPRASANGHQRTSHFIYATLACLLLFTVLARAEVSEKARKLHASSLVFDAHVHVINRQLYLGGDIGERAPDGQVDLPRMREGGLKALFFSLFVTEEYYPPRLETKQTLRLIDMAFQQVERNAARIEFAYNASDISRINATGKIAAVLDLEGGFDLDGDLATLRMLYRLGLRSAQLPAHNWANEFAESCCSKSKAPGLTEHGRAVVREMNRLGMVINLSHASDATIDQTLDVSTDPVLLTHHGLRSFNDIPRNLPDYLLKKLAAKGGAIGFHIGNEFHNRPMFDWRTAHAGKPFWDTTDVARNPPRTLEAIDRLVGPRFPMVGVAAPRELVFSVDDWFKVVDRAIEIAGEDHVMLGTDFDGGPTPPREIRDIRDLPVLTDAMLRRGYSEVRIRKFLGGNLLRVFRQVTERRSP
jgi:membrane dipeptidase